MEQENNKGLKFITFLGIALAVAGVVAVIKMTSEDSKPGLSGSGSYKVKKIGSKHFVVYDYGKSKHADQHGNFHQSDEIMSKPFKTAKGAEKKMDKIKLQAGVK